MNELETIVADTIRAEGPLNLARFMDLALQHPLYGYYRKVDRLGVAGDFITAPEISQIFGELIGVWVADVWRSLGKPDPFILLELGPGRGTLMVDLLRATRKIDGFHQALRLHLLESNETFRVIQKEKLASFSPIHMDDLGVLPNMPMIFVANEFFDALPIHQLLTKDGAFCTERKVGLVDDALAFVADPPIDGADEMKCREVSPMAANMMQSLASHITAKGGAGLVVDYGYAEPSGASSFQAVKAHEMVDPLHNLGEADLTSLVDFTALANKAKSEKARVFGPVSQGVFLERLGIDIRLSMLQKNADACQSEELAVGVRRLIENGQMGSLFKVLAVASSGFTDFPPGFDHD